ncbi:MAG: cyclase family protein [Candidatus Latescibacterota bacterium]|nr:cyclase family protein [Candidatus Latescibacterota bacterium]
MHVLLILIVALLSICELSNAEPKKWQQGKGWGWVWGAEDEVGALNEMDANSVLKALSIVKKGVIKDLGINYDRRSYKWPGHSPGEIMTFRTPAGVKTQKDLDFTLPENGNSSETTWHSCALFINDNVATQIDGLGHAVTGKDNHWYNGFTESDWGGDWGIRKAGAETIPPIVARGILIDVAGFKNLDALPSKYIITPEDLKGALRRQKTDLRFGDVVLIRTGTLRYWNDVGANQEKIGEHDSAGIQLPAAKWLVEEKGAIMIGSDTSGLEQMATRPKDSDSFMPVHNYLLIEQGVHIAEFHYLEDLAKEKVYEFTYIATTNKIKGTTAGFTMRPLAIY